MFFPEVSRTLIISAIASSVLLLLIFVYSFWEDLKFCPEELVIKAEYFAVLMLATFPNHIRRRASCSHLPALIVMMLLIRGKRILEANVIRSVIFFFLKLSKSIWNFNNLIIKNYFILLVWTVYCQHMRPARIAVKQQIFLPPLIVMITLITEGAPPLVTCSLTAVSVLYLRLSVRVPSYDVMMHQSCSYWIRVLMPYVLKPVLIVVLALAPILSEKKILVTGIIVVFVQLFQIPAFCHIIYYNFVPPAVVFFVTGSTSTSVLVLFLVPVLSVTYSFFFPKNRLDHPLFVTVIFTVLAVTINLPWVYISVSVLFPVWLLLGYSTIFSEKQLLITTLILGLVMNVALTKCEIIDIMVLMMTVAIILEASTAPLFIYTASKFKFREQYVFFCSFIMQWKNVVRATQHISRSKCWTSQGESRIFPVSG